MRGLEIGGGTHPKAHHTYEQFDLHSWDSLKGYAKIHIGDARNLSRFEDWTFDHVMSSQTLEHFSWRETPQVLREWWRVLRPGGDLELWLPDILGMYNDYLHKRNTWSEFIERVYGSQDYEGNTHFTMFTIDEWYNFAHEHLDDIYRMTYDTFANGAGFHVHMFKRHIDHHPV